jgi:4-carboxymuconolactone decarboxylase
MAAVRDPIRDYVLRNSKENRGAMLRIPERRHYYSMARLPYTTTAQFAELIRQSGFPEQTPQTNAFRMLAHAPSVSASVLRLVFALLTETALDPELRELVILRVAQRCRGTYVWVQHVALARTAGVSDFQIAALQRVEPPAWLFSDRERTALGFADEVSDACRATDDTFRAVRELFSPREVVELVLLIGYFRMISGLMTTLDVEVEAPFGTRILDLARDAVCGASEMHAG